MTPPLASPTAEPHLVLARLAVPLALEAGQVGLVMWMPGGVHDLQATRGGKPAKVRVRVDPSVAAAAQQSLLRHAARGQRAFFDFDHENRAASAWPTEFLWQDAPKPGVYARVEWSAPGKEAIQGRAYRAFSPTFFVDDSDPARVTGAPINMGGLVNDPAFKDMSPFWASQPNPQANDMDKTEATGTAGTPNPAASTPVQAQQHNAPAGETAGTVVVVDGQKAIEAKEAEIARLKAANETLENQVKAQRKADADARVKEAVARGALPPQNTEIQAKWRDLIEKDPSAATLLADLPGATVLQAGRVTPARDQRVEVGAEDVDRVVKAYHAAATPLERGLIFASELNDRFDREHSRIIRAANVLGTLAGDLVVQRALVLLKNAFPVLTRISTDFSSENAAYGQTVKSRIRSVPAVTDYNTTTGYGTSDATTTDVPVVLNAHKAVQIGFNANELASTRRALFGEQQETIHYALGKTLCDALYALITAGNFTNATTKALVSFGRNDLTAMAKALYDRGVPPMGRTALLNSAYFEKLQQDSAIVNLAAYQRPEVITQYTLPPVAGFEIFQAVNLPTAANLTGFGFTPDSMVMATRVPNDYTQALPGTSHGSVSVVTNPDTGISVSLVQYVDHKLGSAFLRMALMYGVAVGQAASGQRLISA